MGNRNGFGIFSFFSGAGFLDLGFETSGFETLFVNEYHKPFLRAYGFSRGMMGIKPPKYGYSTENVTEFLDEDMMMLLRNRVEESKQTMKAVGFIGGPPCPDFSVAGKNKGKHGENGRLSSTYADIVCGARPDFFLFENVKGLYRTVKHREFFESLKVRFRENGYVLTERLINSLEYGAPQFRERIILIGFQEKYLIDGGYDYEDLSKSFGWSSKTRYSYDRLKTMPWPTQEAFSPDGERPKPEGIVEELTVEHWFRRNRVEEHPNSRHYFQPKAALAKFRVVDEGDDSRKSYKRLHRWRFSPTVAYGNNEVHLHPYKERRLTVAEALSLQSLPMEFEMPDSISLTDMFKSIGNGVPYLAAKGLGETLRDYLKSGK